MENSIRRDVTRALDVTSGGRTVRMEEATLIVPTREAARSVDTACLLCGSLLYVVREGKLYVLDSDGGTWCSAEDGRTLEEDA